MLLPYRSRKLKAQKLDDDLVTKKHFTLVLIQESFKVTKALQGMIKNKESIIKIQQRQLRTLKKIHQNLQNIVLNQQQQLQLVHDQAA